jgi:hypothetical protein
MTTTTPITGPPGVTVPETEEEQRRRQREKNQAAIDLIRSWLDETDPEVIREQRETWEFLKKALDEDRLSPDRKLFP